MVAIYIKAALDKIAEDRKEWEKKPWYRRIDWLFVLFCSIPAWIFLAGIGIGWLIWN